ncbi:MAG: hypothetical protein JWN30_1748 [Bacilli bacterium]|nr:hypothetical protein [Bacilli bacterium]
MLGLRSGFFRTFFYKVGLSGIGFFIAYLTTRYLGASGRGVYSNCTVYLGIYVSLFGAFGNYFSIATNRLGRSSKLVFQMNMSFITWLSLLTLLLTAVLFATKSLWQSHLSSALLVIGIVAPFALLVGFIQRTLNGLHEMERLNRSNTVQPFFFVILAALLVVCLQGVSENQKLVAILASWLVSYLCAAIYSIYLLKQASDVSFAPTAKSPIWREFLSYGTSLSVSNGIESFNTRIDFLLVGWMMSIKESAYYSNAIVVAEVINFIYITITQLTFAKVSSPNREESIRITERAFQLTGAACLAAGIAAIFIIPPIIPLVFGKDFARSVAPFEILVPGVILYGLFVILITFFTNQLGRSRIRIYIDFLGGIIKAACCVLLIPRHGLAGAAMGSLISYFVCCVIAIVIYVRLTERSPIHLFLPARYQRVQIQ